MDVSEIEERHRQQLKELEEAMRSTWEEKARVSEVSIHTYNGLFNSLF